MFTFHKLCPWFLVHFNDISFSKSRQILNVQSDLSTNVQGITFFFLSLLSFELKGCDRNLLLHSFSVQIHMEEIYTVTLQIMKFSISIW